MAISDDGDDDVDIVDDDVVGEDVDDDRSTLD